MPFKEISRYYRSCELFVLPSWDREAFGIVYLEAGLQGRPVIASRSGGVEEAVRDTETGLLVDERNSDQIRDAAVRLLTDETLAEKLGEQGRIRASKDFNIEEQRKKLKTILS